jgi:hypothetical protein
MIGGWGSRGMSDVLYGEYGYPEYLKYLNRLLREYSTQSVNLSYSV